MRFFGLKMGLFGRKTKIKVENPKRHFEEEENEPSFLNTFGTCAFAMCWGAMYPNEKGEGVRFVMLCLIVLSMFPACYLGFYDCYVSYLVGDYDTIIRHWTLLLPLSMMLLKSFSTWFQSKPFLRLINTCTADLRAWKRLDEKYQEVIGPGIKAGKRAEKSWCTMSLVVMGLFPATAIITMIYNTMTTDGARRVMYYELHVPFITEKQYETPWFEIIFLYMTYFGTCFYTNFTAFDGCFGILVNHGAMKVRMVGVKLTRMLEEAKRVEDARSAMRAAIREHCKALDYIGETQAVFGVWLGAIFIFTIIQVSICLYQLTQNETPDYRYVTFCGGAIIQMFIPCHYAANLTFACKELYVQFYLCRWEKFSDKWVTDTVRVMIMRAQESIFLTGAGMVEYNMELFVTILKSSYSMYTLLAAE